MGTEKLSPARRAILALLTESPALTTSQIAESLACDTTRRALQQHLAGLRDAGLISEAKSRPALGAASERSWTILAAGSAQLPASPELQTAPATRERRRPCPPLTANQIGILALLAEWKQLTTGQIGRYLHADKPRRYTQRLLTELKARRLVAAAPVDPSRGTAAEHYWMLRSRGAAVTGAAPDQHAHRRPHRATLDYRGLQLDLLNQVADASWQLLRPLPYSRNRPRPAETPQYRQLVAAVVDHERQEIARLLAAGQSQASLQPRVDRATSCQVGALVPPGVNEYVAYVPGQPARTALLLPHPPQAGRAFWTRKPEPGADRTAQRSRRDSRVDRYARLAAILPVIAVFGDEELGRQYASLLQLAGFSWVVVDQLGVRLRRLGI